MCSWHNSTPVGECQARQGVSQEQLDELSTKYQAQAAMVQQQQQQIADLQPQLTSCTPQEQTVRSCGLLKTVTPHFVAESRIALEVSVRLDRKVVP